MNIKKLFEEIENVFVEKQSKYGQVDVKIKNMLKELYPNGVKPEQYNEFMNVLKMLDIFSSIFKTFINSLNCSGFTPFG